MKDAVASARAISLGEAVGRAFTASRAAEEAYRLSMREPDFYQLTRSSAETTRSNVLPSNCRLKAGVVDSGSAGFCYFLEGVLRFFARCDRARCHRGVRCAVKSSPNIKRSEKSTSSVHGFRRSGFHNRSASLARSTLTPLGNSLVVAGGRRRSKFPAYRSFHDDVFALAQRLTYAYRKKSPKIWKSNITCCVNDQ
jgi:hypothetical protein